MTPHLAFDEDGTTPIATTDFVYPEEAREGGQADLDAIRQEIAVNLLRMLCHKSDCRRVGQQALVLGYVMHAIDVKTQKELAKRLGLSKGRVSKVVNQVREDFLRIGAD